VTARGREEWRHSSDVCCCGRAHHGGAAAAGLRGEHERTGRGRYDTTLQEASAEGHEAVVQLLLDRGAKVNAHDMNL